nr:hypothetical protein BaRGS_009551 [Batillaria attramentaria]
MKEMYLKSGKDWYWAQEDLNESKRIYEELHNEMCTELPDFYNSRVTFYADLFQKLFSCERTLHSETSRMLDHLYGNQDVVMAAAKVNGDVDKVNEEDPQKHNTDDNTVASSQETAKFPSVLDILELGADTFEPPLPSQDTERVSKVAENEVFLVEPYLKDDRKSTEQKVKDSGSGKGASREDMNRNFGGQSQEQIFLSLPFSSVSSQDDLDNACGDQRRTFLSLPFTMVNREDLAAASDAGNKDRAEPVTNNYYEEPHGSDKDDDDDDEEDAAYQSPPSNKPVCEPPPDTLYQVEATHAYSGEDIDELSFDPGDIIYVVKFENEEEQDEGWQMGVKQKDGLKGVFPENFTRRL